MARQVRGVTHVDELGQQVNVFGLRADRHGTASLCGLAEGQRIREHLVQRGKFLALGAHRPDQELQVLLQTAKAGYFDTSALMRWLEFDVPSPKELNARIAPVVDQVLASTDRLAISEMTILELLSSVTRNWRMQDAQSQPFDAAWAIRSRQRFMNLIATGRVEIIEIPPRAAEHAIAIVDLAAAEHQQALGVQDAIHLITSCAWAYREKATCSFYTSDDDYDQFTALYPHYLRFANVVNLDVLTRPASA